MKPILIIIFALFCLLPLQAQNTVRKDSLMNRELMLEKEYNPTIRDAVKLSQLPELREPQAPKSQVEFSNYTVPYDVQMKLVQLNPQAWLTNMNYSKYKGYLTAGISSLIDIDGDAGYQLLNTNKDRLNIFFSHRSSGCDITYLQDVSDLGETGKQKFKINDNWGGLNFMHDFDGVKFLADAKYTYSAFNYYGLSIPLNIRPSTGYYPNNNFDKNTNQVNNIFEARLGVLSDKPHGLDYKINAGFTTFGQKYGRTIAESGSKENRILIDGDIHQKINSTTDLGISGFIKIYSYSNEIFKSLNDTTTNYWVYSLNPYLYWEGESVNLLLGARMDVEVGGRQKVIVSPAIRFNYSFDNQFMFYINAEGGRKDNSQYGMFYENRYADPLIRIVDSRSPLNATVGIKFTPLSTMSVGIFGGYKITKDEHFFYSNYGAKYFGTIWSSSSIPMLSGNWITPAYQDANTIKLGTNFKYAFQKTFELTARGTYYHWNINTEYFNEIIPLKAWNKPGFDMNLNAAYHFDMLPLRFDLSYYGAYGRKALSFKNGYDNVNMKNINDLSIKGTYSFTPNFSVYGSLRNMLPPKYDIWWGYPAQPFSIMGGLSVLF
jgi:hypothetical protein